MAIANSGFLNTGNIFSQSYANIFNLLNNKNNVPDPVGGLTSQRQFVYSREPEISHQNFQGYPFIILWPAKTDFKLYNLEGSSSIVQFDFMIEIRCTDKLRGREGSGKAGRTAQVYLDQISDNIIKTLNNTTNRKFLNIYGQGGSNIDTQNVEALDVNDDIVWVRMISIMSKSRVRTG